MKPEHAAHEAMYDEAEIRTNVVCRYAAGEAAASACDAATWRALNSAYDVATARRSRVELATSDCVWDASGAAVPK